jgi:HK97 family phage prohead protease/HK97 family phage major capsid protein
VAQDARAKYVDHTLDLSGMQVRAFEDAEGTRIIEGIATTPAEDRMGDVVLSEGAVFQLPIPLLWQHNPAQPIGNVTTAHVTPQGIRIRAEIAPAGTLSAIDGHWSELKSGLVRYLSIGFRELKSKAGKAGRVFTSWEWLELSAVTIPANADTAITTVRAYAVPTRDAQQRPPNVAHAPATARTVGAPAAPHATPRLGAATMKLSEKIAARQAAIGQLKDRLAVVTSGEDEADQFDEQRQAEVEELSLQIDNETRALEMLQRAEHSLATRATVPTTHAVQGTVMPRSVSVVTPRNAPKGDLLFKALAAAFYSHIERRGFDAVLQSYYPGHSELEAFVKATAAPADTVTPGWAAELVTTTVADFMESLEHLSVYAALSGKGIRFGFGRAGKVIVPARASSTLELAGDWIGEGAPIPVKQGSIAGATLLPHKLAVISTFTRELAMHSTPQIETLIRQMILEDTAGALDKFLTDNVAASAIRPAGLQNGVTPIGSSGITAANILTDLKAAQAPILAAGGGRRLVWLMHPVRLAAVGMLQSASGTFVYRDELAQGRLIGYEVIASTNIPQDTVILVDAAEFASATGDVPAFDVSDVATLHMAAPASPIGTAGSPATVAAPVRSLWQTASIGVRMIQDLSWAMRRPGMVSALSGVAW